MELNDLQLFLKQNVTYLLSYLGALQGFILAIIVLYYPQQHKISNRILSVFLFSLAYLLLIARIVELIDFPYMRLIYGLRSLAPIGLYLYIQSLYKSIEWKKQYWHLLVLLIDFVVIYGFVKMKNNTIGDDPVWNSVELASLGWAWFILIFSFYFVAIYRVLQQYKGKVLDNFSNLHNLGSKWVTQIFFGFLGLIGIDILVGIFSIAFPVAYAPYHGLVNTITYTAFMYFITIKGKLTPQIYKLKKLQDKPLTLVEVPIPESNKEIFKKKKELKHLSNQIIEIIEEEKLYKEMGLSVNDVADKIGVQTYLVSQAINSCLDKNFFEVINRYRVEEAKELLLDETKDYLSIVGIGFEAGFSSKTAFNTAFKKYTGMTPSEFKKAGNS